MEPTRIVHFLSVGGNTARCSQIFTHAPGRQPKNKNTRDYIMITRTVGTESCIFTDQSCFGLDHFPVATTGSSTFIDLPRGAFKKSYVSWNPTPHPNSSSLDSATHSCTDDDPGRTLFQKGVIDWHHRLLSSSRSVLCFPDRVPDRLSGHCR